MIKNNQNPEPITNNTIPYFCNSENTIQNKNITNEMTETYRYNIGFDDLEIVSPLLEKHYGLGVSYFIDNYRDGDSDSVILEFPCSYEDFLSCFKAEREFINKDGIIKYKKCDLPNIPENEHVIDAIFLIISVCGGENFVKEKPKELIDTIPSEEYFYSDDEYQEFMNDNYNDLLCNFYEDMSRKDLLELYLYCINKSRLEDCPSQLTIKYGNKSLKIDNKDNWFERVLLSNHFDNYLPDIKNEQDAITALNAIKHPGRELSRPLLYHFLYGTYRMISEHLHKETVTDSFCELMLALMEQMDYPLTYVYSGGKKKGEIKDIDSQYIRKMISKLKSQAKDYKFDIGVALRGEKAMQALKKSGRSLYQKMMIPFKFFH